VFVAINWDDLWFVSERLIVFGDSWFSAKAIKVVCFLVNKLGKALAMPMC